MPFYLLFTCRTCNVDELPSIFNDLPERSLVAEDIKSAKIVDFALGVILKRSRNTWKYRLFQLDKRTNNQAEKWRWKEIVQQVGKTF